MILIIEIHNIFKTNIFLIQCYNFQRQILISKTHRIITKQNHNPSKAEISRKQQQNNDFMLNLCQN